MRMGRPTAFAACVAENGFSATAEIQAQSVVCAYPTCTSRYQNRKNRWFWRTASAATRLVAWGGACAYAGPVARAGAAEHRRCVRWRAAVAERCAASGQWGCGDAARSGTREVQLAGSGRVTDRRPHARLAIRCGSEGRSAAGPTPAFGTPHHHRPATPCHVSRTKNKIVSALCRPYLHERPFWCRKRHNHPAQPRAATAPAHPRQPCAPHSAGRENV